MTECDCAIHSMVVSDINICYWNVKILNNDELKPLLCQVTDYTYFS